MKLFTKLFLVTGLVTVAALTMTVIHTYALFNTTDATGYFYGNFFDVNSTNGKFVLPQNSFSSTYGPVAIPDYIGTQTSLSANKTAFENFILGYYNHGDFTTGNRHEIIGAAFIIQTMLGSKSTNLPTQADITTWKASIDSTSVAVDWFHSQNYSYNSLYDKVNGDAVPYQNNGMATSIVFKNLSGSQTYYLLKRYCGNPIGDPGSPGLPPPTPVSFNTSVDGVKIDDSGFDGTNYGGDCAAVISPATGGCSKSLAQAPYSDDNFTMGNVSTVPNNYFSKGDVQVPSGGRIQEFDVTDQGTPDTGWVLVGRSVCVDESADSGYPCSSSNMAFNGHYFVSTASNTFSKQIYPNQHLHIRWIYHNTQVGSVDGVKIDDTGFSSTNYGGDCARVNTTDSLCSKPIGSYQFSDNNVLISGYPSTGNNHFNIPSVTAGQHVFSVTDAGAPDSNWTVIGYSICDDQALTPGLACSSANVAYGGGYYHALPVFSNSFIYNIQVGHHYHMRWVYTLAAKVAGVKIDESNDGTTATNYGGHCAGVTSSGAGTGNINCNNATVNAYPFSDNKVQQADTTGTANYLSNAFFFPGIRAGTQPTFSVAASGVSDGGYNLVGYSFCDEAAGDCTSDNLAYGAKYYKPITGTSFTAPSNLIKGHNYNIRFIYSSSIVVKLTNLQSDGTVYCAGSLSGTATDPTNPGSIITVQVYVDGKKGSSPAPRTVSLVANQSGHNFSQSIAGLNTKVNPTRPTTYQDGLPHKFYLYASRSDGTGSYNNEASPAQMTGCGAFSINLSPQISLAPDSQNPTTYTSTNKISASYTGWAGGIIPPNISGNDTNSVTKNGVGIYSLGHSYLYPAGYGSYTYTHSGSIGGFTAGDEYCSIIISNRSSGIVSTNGDILKNNGNSASTPVCTTISNEPIFKVINSSILAGGTVGQCDGSNANAGTLAGWYNNSPLGSSGYGSGAQLATFALSQVYGVASARNYGTTKPPTYLSFANNIAANVSISSNLPGLGGKFGGQNCITPLATVPVTSGNVGNNTTVTLSSLLSGPDASSTTGTGNKVALKNPNLIKKVGPSEHHALYVDGDIYIQDNITYDTTGWTMANVPSLLVVATGNIYIDKSVTQLDGTYQAGGTIYTCSNSFSSVLPAAMYAECDKQLQVNGSFVGTNVKLMRTYGSLRNEKTPLGTCDGNTPGSSTTNFIGSSMPVNTCAAEVFRFSPEQYLEQPAALPTAGGANRYDAITSLPPVL